MQKFVNQKLYDNGVIVMFKRIISSIFAVAIVFSCTAIGFSQAASDGTVPYQQFTSIYADATYTMNDGTVKTLGDTGCGIYSTVNLVEYFTGNYINPKELGDWAYNNYGFNRYSGGIDGSVYFKKLRASSYPTTYGFTVESDTLTWSDGSNTTLQNHVAKANGGAVILVEGHYIAVVDYDSATDKYLVLDSAANPTKRGTNATPTWVPKSYTVSGTSFTVSGTAWMKFRAFVLFTITTPTTPTTHTTPAYTNLGDSFYARVYNSEYDKYLCIDGNGEPFADIMRPDQSQVWKFERMDSDNAYKITNTKNNLLLDLMGGDAALGTNIITYQDVGSTAQRWYLVSANDGYVFCPKAAPDNAMDIDVSSQASIACWNNYSGANQTFQVVKVSSAYELSGGEPANLGDIFHTYLYNSAYGKYVGIVNDNPTALAKNNDGSQLWRFDREAEDGSYRITNVKTGKLLDLANESTALGADITTNVGTGSWAQRWYIVSKNGGYVLQCKAAKSNALDIDTGAQTAIASWNEYGGVNQTFKIEKLNVYTLNSYIQKETGMASSQNADNYTLYSTELLTSAFGKEVTAPLKSFIGFVAPAETTVTPSVYGSTTIDYFYRLIYGDVNRDNTVNATDIVLLKRRIIEKSTSSSATTEKLSDVNGDGKVSLGDLLRLKLYLSDATVKVGD